MKICGNHMRMSWNVLWGCVIPINNATSINLSTAAYLLTHFLSLSYPKTQPLDLASNPLKSTSSQRAFLFSWLRIRLRRSLTTLWTTLWIVITHLTSTNVLGNQYRVSAQTDMPLVRCGVNIVLPIEKFKCQSVRRSSGMSIEIVLTWVQAYSAWSHRWIKWGMIVKVYGEFLVI